MTWKDAIKALKAYHVAGADSSPATMQKELLGLEESLKGWESRDEHRERSFVAWREQNATLRADKELFEKRWNDVETENAKLRVEVERLKAQSELIASMVDAKQAMLEAHQAAGVLIEQQRDDLRSQRDSALLQVKKGAMQIDGLLFAVEEASNKERVLDLQVRVAETWTRDLIGAIDIDHHLERGGNRLYGHGPCEVCAIIERGTEKPVEGPHLLLSPDGSAAPPVRDLFSVSRPEYHFTGDLPKPRADEVCPHRLWQDGFLVKCACCAGSWGLDGKSRGGVYLGGAGSNPWCVNSGEDILVLPSHPEKREGEAEKLPPHLGGNSL